MKKIILFFSFVGSFLIQHDKQFKGGTGFDTQDILATGLGGLSGASIVLFVYKF